MWIICVIRFRRLHHNSVGELFSTNLDNRKIDQICFASKQWIQEELLIYVLSSLEKDNCEGRGRFILTCIEIVPSPSVSNNLKASLYSVIWASLSSPPISGTCNVMSPTAFIGFGHRVNKIKQKFGNILFYTRYRQSSQARLTTQSPVWALFHLFEKINNFPKMEVQVQMQRVMPTCQIPPFY